MKKALLINEFAEISGIEKTTLRYWDEIGLFSPTVRDPRNHYRYYSPHQLITINFIKVLSQLNIPLKAIGKYASIRNPDSIIKLLEQQERRLDQEMSRLHDCYAVLHERRSLIQYGMQAAQEYETGNDQTDIKLPAITVKHLEEKPYIIGSINKHDENEPFYEAFMTFCRQAGELRLNLSYPIAGYYESMEDFVKIPGLPKYFISLDPQGNRKLPAGNYLVGFHRGFYGEHGNFPQQMADYAKEHHLTPAGPLYALYLLDEVCIRDPSQYLAQICVAIS